MSASGVARGMHRGHLPPPLLISTRVDQQSQLLTVTLALKVVLVVEKDLREADYKAVSFLTNLSLTSTCGERVPGVHIGRT